MNKEKIEQLARIYNTLLAVSTKGDDTIVMAQCLIALKDWITKEGEMLSKEE